MIAATSRVFALNGRNAQKRVVPGSEVGLACIAAFRPWSFPSLFSSLFFRLLVEDSDWTYSSPLSILQEQEQHWMDFSGRGN